MITPSFGLTATERVLPKLALDFTTATLDPRVTFTRSGNTATYTNSSGVITAIDADLPRFDYNPTTLACRGLLIEEARTNLLLNSLIDGTSLTTQSVTVAATAYTLSFYGTGSIDLSGTHTATVTGTGAYPSRKTYTFTPTAGTLTLTVTGTVQYAQLEAGGFATSYIPTTTTALTRNADVATMTGTNFSDWYNPGEGTLKVEYTSNGSFSGNGSLIAGFFNGDGASADANSIQIGFNGSAYLQVQGSIVKSGTYQKNYRFDVALNTKNKYALAYSTTNNSAYGSSNGGVPTVATITAGIPTVTELHIGFLKSSYPARFTGTFQKIFYYSQELTQNEVRAISK